MGTQESIMFSLPLYMFEIFYNKMNKKKIVPSALFDHQADYIIIGYLYKKRQSHLWEMCSSIYNSNT